MKKQITMAPNLSSALQPLDIGLILTYHCQAACAHCLYNCHPQRTKWITPDEARQALQKAQSVWGCGFQVHLTGGEPLAHFPLTLQITHIARELEIPTYIETNASWCKTASMAENRFQQLWQAGLQAVLISVSPFHQAAIPLSRTMTGIAAARAVFGAGRVMIYQSQWLPEMTAFGLKNPVPLAKYEEKYGAKSAAHHLWEGFGLIGGGRAGFQLSERLSKRPPDAFQGLNCVNELAFARHSHMDLFGHFIPGFCGGISLGDWHDLQNLVSAFRAGQHPEIIKMLLAKGPYGLYRWAAQIYNFKPDPAGYAGKCHLCTHIRRHLNQMKIFSTQLQPAAFYGYF